MIIPSLAVGDVWILGAGTSAEQGAPTVKNFRDTARTVLESCDRSEYALIKSVLDFWDDRLPSFNFEEVFGFLDSASLARATRERDAPDLRERMLFTIAKVITQSLGESVSGTHLEFANQLRISFAPIITLNWDILLDRAIVESGSKVEYALPRAGEWNPHASSERSIVLMKLHGSLNWLVCGEKNCGLVSYFGEKKSATEFLRTRTGLACSHCGSEKKLDILFVPPVLAKLGGSDGPLLNVWENAYSVLTEARRVYIAGYSFPSTDIQIRLFLNKALRAAKNLNRVCVITTPKFGTARTHFEDHYVGMLSGSGKQDQIDFVYKRFGRVVTSRQEPCKD